MAVSNVYYTNMRTTLTENLLQKLEIFRKCSPHVGVVYI